MKKMKRIISIFMSFVMLFGTCMVSFAEESNANEIVDEIDCATDSDAEDLDTEDPDTEDLDTEEIEASVDSLFKVPYVSTYYFNPKPSPNDNIKIPIYLTDYEQSEYLKNNTTKTLDLIYEVDGVAKTIKDVPLGDYTLTIGKLNEGMHTFSLQVLDNTTGMKSHKLYNELWVSSEVEYTSAQISAMSAAELEKNKIYKMTSADLQTYKINNQDSTNATDLINTRDGLNKLFADKQAAGYKRIILLKGTYRINGEKTNRTLGNKDIFYITIPSHFTVDMNGSTFKLNPITVDKDSDVMAIGCIVRVDDGEDVHITNGTLVGDRFERQAVGLETEKMSEAAKGEAINTLLFSGGKYCTATYLTIKDTTGHTIGSGNVSGPYTMIQTYTNVAIIDGKEVPSDYATTSSMIDLTKMKNWAKYDGYIYISHLLGYKGIQGESPIIYASFYDENKKFIETITGYQYRKIKVPDNAKYVRATVAGTIDNEADYGFHTITVQTQHLGDYYEFSNIDFYDTRTTAIAASCGNNVLIENCTYTRCGNSITPAAVDFEEGGEECQDYYYRNNKVLVAAGTVTFIDCAGFNHVFENNVGHNMIIRSRVMGAVLRNTNDSGTRVTWQLGNKKTGANCRAYKNNCGYIKFSTSESNCIEFKVKDSTLRCNGASFWIEAVKDKVTYENCIFPNLSGKNATFVNCTIQPGGQLAEGYNFYNCTFKVVEGSGNEVSLNLPYNTDKLFDHCKFIGKTSLYSSGSNTGFNLGTYKYCEFENLKISASLDANSGKTLFENCTINTTADTFINVGGLTKDKNYTYLQFKNCDITQSGTGKFIYLNGKPIGNSQILFDGCTINKSAGLLVDVNTTDLAQVKDEISIDIKFVGTTIDKNLAVDFATLNSSQVRISYGEPQKKNGFVVEAGKTYYYVDDAKQYGWKQLDSVWYYFGADGVMSVKKWVSYNGKWYYFGENGAMSTNKWVASGKTWYYVGADGIMYASKWLSSGGKWYYFDANGVMMANKWLLSGGKWYYFGADGSMYTSKWLSSGGKWYYFGADGAMFANKWLLYKENWYYFNSTGAMVTGKQLINGKTYVFNSSGVYIN